MAGRPRKPDAIKALTGTLQPCRASDAIDFGKLEKVPPAPSHLNKPGRLIYRKVAARFIALNLLSDINLEIIQAYANEMGKYIEAEQILQESGRLEISKDAEGNILKITRLPLDKMASEYFDNAKKLAVELGITPASAGKIKLPEVKSSNPFDNF